MIAQKGPEFETFSEAAAFFYEKFSESAPLRFNEYLLASGGREIEAAAKYRWNLELSEALIPCLHAAELALKNAIHQAMCRKYPPTKGSTFPDGQPADNEWWFGENVKGKPILRDKDWDKVAAAFEKIPKNGRPISPRVVAELPFGFWVDLLNSNYDESIVVPMLGSTMKKVQRSNPSNRKHGWLRRQFGEIRDLRNRVMHHEPVYHLGNLLPTWEMAWLLSHEIALGFTVIVRKSCRFEVAYKAQWHMQEAAIRERVRTDLFEKFKKAPPE